MLAPAVPPRFFCRTFTPVRRHFPRPDSTSCHACACAATKRLVAMLWSSLLLKQQAEVQAIAEGQGGFGMQGMQYTGPVVLVLVGPQVCMRSICEPS